MIQTVNAENTAIFLFQAVMFLVHLYCDIQLIVEKALGNLD